MLVLLMGPSGSGKTTVGRALADATGWAFHDADDLHPEANVEKMRKGGSLDDDDRDPWLDRVRDLIVSTAIREHHAVVACSALRESYRRRLDAGIPDLRWVYLHASADVLRQRLATRQGHFAGAAILAGQLQTLQMPGEALVVDAERTVGQLVQDICTKLGLDCGTGEPRT
jgi:carbohydrate kinase (thermoresistant glucokinase family)